MLNSVPNRQTDTQTTLHATSAAMGRIYTMHANSNFHVWLIITSPTEGDGRLCSRRRQYVGRYIGVYVCEQLPGANSSPIVTKLGQSYSWPKGTR